MSWPTAFFLAVLAICVTSCVIVHPHVDKCDIRAICKDTGK